jgi:hypothetical protein
MNTQSLFTANLKAAVEARGLTLITDTDWANTGTFRIVEAAAMRQHLSIGYSFQSGYCTLTVKGADGKDLHTFHYVEFNFLALTLTQILNWLPKATPKKKTRKSA